MGRQRRCKTYVGKHLAPDPPGHGLLYRVAASIGLTLGGALIVVAAFIGAQAMIQHRSPGDVVSGYIVASPQALFHKDRINVLLLGIDYDYDSKDQEYSSSARSDTIMAVALGFPSDGHTKPTVNILSVPRDTDVVMPNGREDKINVAYAVGGPKFSEKVIAQFLGIPRFDRYVTLRINATKELIDAVGGLDVVPDETMNYDDNWGHLHIHFVGGKKYHMNGEQAVSYSRFRHDACSDPCRIKRQQQVVHILIAKLKGGVFNDLVHARDLIGVVNRNVLTDLSGSEELSLANALRGIDPKDVHSDQVPFAGDKVLPCCGDVLVADDTAKDKLVRKFFLEPVVAPTPADSAAVAAVPAASIKVDVRNGSGTPGLGRRLASELRAKGFTIASIANADKFSYHTTEIHVHSAARPLAGERVRLAIPLRAVAISPDATAPSTVASDVTVIVGRDYALPSQREASTIK
jgi:LCP family protein required for cell wall assembly